MFAPDASHSYSDKFTLAEFVTKSTFGALANAINEISDQTDSSSIIRTVLGKRLGEVSRNQSVYLTFSSEERCEFSHWEARDIDNGVKVVEESSGIFGSQKKSTKIVNTVNDSYWTVTVEYHVNMSLGRDSNAVVVPVVSKRLHRTIVTTTTAGYTPATVAPMPAVYLLPVRRVDVSPLFRHLVTTQDGDDTQTVAAIFNINRLVDRCVYMESINTGQYNITNINDDSDFDYYYYYYYYYYFYCNVFLFLLFKQYN